MAMLVIARWWIFHPSPVNTMEISHGKWDQAPETGSVKCAAMARNFWVLIQRKPTVLLKESSIICFVGVWYTYIYIYNTYILYIYTYTYICVYIYICIGRDRWYRLGVANPNKTQCLQLVNTLCHSIIPNQPGKTQTTDHQASCRGYIIHLYLNIWWLKPFHHCWWSTK